MYTYIYVYTYADIPGIIGIMFFLFGSTWRTLSETSSFVIPLRRPKLEILHPKPQKLKGGYAGDSIQEFGDYGMSPRDSIFTP